MKLYGYLLVTIVLGIGILAAIRAARAESAKADQFEALEYKDADGNVLRYRLLKPAGADAPQKKRPLLLFLHGAGERGSDNKAQLKHGKEMMLTAAGDYGAFVLAPQCPKGKKWAEVDWSKRTHKMPKEPSQSMRLVMELIDKMQKEFRIDPDRLYVMGLSMGGYGTWDALQRWPDAFAAGVPICGGGDETAADRIKAPVWAFHGDKDKAVPVSRSRNMIQAIKKAGGKPKYTEYPGVGHFAWVPAFKDPEMLKWLFSQKGAGN